MERSDYAPAPIICSCFVHVKNLLQGPFQHPLNAGRQPEPCGLRPSGRGAQGFAPWLPYRFPCGRCPKAVATSRRNAKRLFGSSCISRPRPEEPRRARRVDGRCSCGSGRAPRSVRRPAQGEGVAGSYGVFATRSREDRWLSGRFSLRHFYSRLQPFQDFAAPFPGRALFATLDFLRMRRGLFHLLYMCDLAATAGREASFQTANFARETPRLAQLYVPVLF